MQSKVTLGYWAIRGLAERVRQLLQFTGVSYDEVKYNGQIDGQQRRKWFQEDKPQLSKRNPAITLPYLIDGDKVITQSDAVCIYICHKANRLDLLGRNADEQVQLYTVLGVQKDAQHAYVDYVYGNYGEGQFEIALGRHREFCRKFKEYLKKFDGLLGQKKFICGQGLVWLDFVLADFFQTLNLFEPMLFDEFANLLNYQKRVWGLPQLKNYFESERWSERPCNNVTGKWR